MDRRRALIAMVPGFLENPVPETSLSMAEAYGRYFVVTAVDAAGNESGWSNEVARS